MGNKYLIGLIKPIILYEAQIWGLKEQDKFKESWQLREELIKGVLESNKQKKGEVNVGQKTEYYI